MARDLFVFRHHVNQLKRSILRMARHKANRKIAFDRANAAKKFSEITFTTKFLAIGIDILTEQGNLTAAGCHKVFYFFQNTFGTAASFSTAYVRHDAVGAEIVAAVHDAHPSAERAFTANGNTLGNNRLTHVREEESLLFSDRAVQDLRHTPQRLCAENKIHVRIALFHLVAHALFRYHAAADTDEKRRLFGFQMLVSARDRERLFLCVTAHGAGVDHDNIRFFLGIGLFIAHSNEHAHHALAVCLVLLAAVSDDAGFSFHAVGKNAFNFINI